MKKIINYEKDILFKTNIGEICSISLEYDFTVDEGILKGEFIVDGEYKANELSINKEPFLYRLPLEYELEESALIDTLSYDVDNFEYTVKDDCLTVIIDFCVRYEEKKIVPNIPEITEEELNLDDIPLPRLNEALREEENIEEIPIDEPVVVDMVEEEDDRLGTEDEQIIMESTAVDDEYITYHVHIVQEGETLESIASSYSTTTDVIREYNSIEVVEAKSKLIIPIMNE